jgi:hypothetical protein
MSVGFLLVADLFWLLRYGYQETISYQTLELSRSHPIVPFLVGFGVGLLAGHLFFPQ